MENSILDSVNDPEDLKKLSAKELKQLSEEIRAKIIEVVSRNGGHLASNLGVIELTIALHYVFNSPEDKIIWDVGHQSYTHKILTGRKDKFSTIRQSGGLSGFPKQSESSHDPFDTGHASTSISAGLGILTGLRMNNRKGRVIAVIGDASLTGGMAFEALNHAGHLAKDLVVILNDNNMAINASVGALSHSLSRLTTTSVYQAFRRKVDNIVRKIPLVGGFFYDLIIRAKKGIKAVFYKATIFSDFGFQYVGPIDGHSIPQLINELKKVKKISKPVVVHVSTIKGKGCDYAEINPAQYHGVNPASIVDGIVEKKSSIFYTEAFSSLLMDFAAKDESIVAITAAMTEGTGLKNFSQKYPDRFFDVGIAEQHAVTFAAGLSVSGLKPVVAIYSTFMQRAVDQLIHDIAIPGLPAVIIMDRSGIVGHDGETHQGIFDIALFRAVPNIQILAPFDQYDLGVMMEYAFSAGKPVLLRLPKDTIPELFGEKDSLTEGRGRFLFKNTSEILIIGYGGILSNIIEAGYQLSRKGIETDIYNLCFLKPVDENYLADIISGYKKVFLFEDSISANSIGEYVSSIIVKNSIPVEFYFYGIDNHFPTHASRKELLKNEGLDPENIFRIIGEKYDSR